MSRRRKKTKKNKKLNSQREYHYNAKRKTLLRLHNKQKKQDVIRRSYHSLPLISDQRFYNPYPDTQYRVSGQRVNYTVRPPRQQQQTKAINNYTRDRTLDRVSYTDPLRTTTCIRRRRRREILFKSGKAGKGKKIKTPRIMRDHSKVRC